MTTDKNTLTADVKEKTNNICEDMYNTRKALQSDYFHAASKLQSDGFSNHHEQADAIRKVSQLGLAYHAYCEAYSAVNAVRCNWF